MLIKSETTLPTVQLPTEKIIVTQGQSRIFVTCRTNPRNIVTRWTFNGVDLPTDNTETLDVRGRFNHTLSISNPTLEYEGTYKCRAVDTDVTASFDLTVKPGDDIA